MKKKLAACMTAVCLAATAVGATVAMTGCGSSGLRVMLLANETEQSFYTQYFKEMAEKYETKITFTGYEEGDYYSALSSAMQQGKTPDIFFLRPNELKQFKSKIVSLEDFSKTLKENENLHLDLNDIYDLALDMFRVDEKGDMKEGGELYAFPKDLSVQQLGYNKTLVAKSTAEIHAEKLPLPWELGVGDYASKLNYNWNEYLQICEIIADKGVEEGGSVNTPSYWASDIPDIEILAKSFGGSIYDRTTNKVTIVNNAAVTKAVAYQEKLVTARSGHAAAADYDNATQANFKAGKVAFYGAIGTWEVGDYDGAQQLGKDHWDVMAWPVDGDNATQVSENAWTGRITTAGYVVSSKCKNKDIAMEIAASFMTTKTQERLFKTEKLSVPLNKKLRDSYLDADNDAIYSPKHREIFLQVIDGSHGFLPAEYYTYNKTWLGPLNDALKEIWTGAKGASSINADVQTAMQAYIDRVS